jgi:DNA-binding CsgD family transcriptional regulator
VEQYTAMMLQEQQALKQKRLHYNLIEAVVDSQTEQHRREMQIDQLERANQRLWMLVFVVLSLVAISVVAATLLRQRRAHRIQLQNADNKLASLAEELKQTTAEKEMMSQKFDEIMEDMDSRQELESLTPSVLQKKGESKFRQRFELLYPLFLPRLRERVPTITRREELLSMLIVLKQDNKEIAELLAIAPRSVLMLRHRFRQKIGLAADILLEDFIEDVLSQKGDGSAVPKSPHHTHLNP